MKIKVYFGLAKTILLGAVALLATAAIVVNALFLAGVGALVTTVPLAAGISLGFSVLILAFAATIFFNSNYQFGDERLTANISFFKDYVEYSDITDIKENSENKALYVVFKYENEKVAGRLSSLRLLVKPDQNQKIVDFIKAKNAAVIFESFIPQNKDENKNDDGKDNK